MTEPDQDQNVRPRTGVDEIDAALTDLDGLADLPVAEHHDRLSRVHEALHAALHQPSDRSADSPS
ncbi:hypothetical protein [Microlunatus parietis]|uniref:Uncharacterized protein n=1 Tax=Microlunatus parietis TaxID=682979 RepID=A0A7Y9I3R5_9ACTN|nr:hypothetical protein [Microlunatus parietis]NYE69627.1 hypothetical protein [Microlunatus parietis]